jgi:Spy/CpxP family protein refolding chaperone
MRRASWAQCGHPSFGPRGFFSHSGPWGFKGFMPCPSDEGFGAGGGFGVRRPLRFLAHRLDLDDKQVEQLARILDELKIERAQAAVDDRRALADFADAVSGEQFDAAKADSAGQRRTDSTQRLRATLNRSLEQIHAMLNPEQRIRLAHLIRTGVLTV